MPIVPNMQAIFRGHVKPLQQYVEKPPGMFRDFMLGRHQDFVVPDVAVFLEQQSEELPHIMADNIHLQPLNNARIFKRLFAKVETDDFFQRKNMRPAQIVIGVGRRKPIKVRATDRREKLDGVVEPPAAFLRAGGSRLELEAAVLLVRQCAAFVAHRVFERVRYQERPERYEYRLTEKGRDLYPVIVALVGWGDRWLAGRAGAPIKIGGFVRYALGEGIEKPATQA